MSRVVKPKPHETASSLSVNRRVDQEDFDGASCAGACRDEPVAVELSLEVSAALLVVGYYATAGYQSTIELSS